MKPLTFVKLRVHQNLDIPRVDVANTLAVDSDLRRTSAVFNMKVDSYRFSQFSHAPEMLTSASSVHSMLDYIDSTKVCIGNPDGKFLELWKHRSTTLHGSSSGQYSVKYLHYVYQI